MKKLREDGIVSVTITVILMIIISITVLSFAQIVRREQRQALDNHLSNQAFYAAESGVNDARAFIQKEFIAKGLVIPDKHQCQNAGTPYGSLAMNMDDSRGYTCLLVTGSPKSLYYDLSTSASSMVFPIDANGNGVTGNIINTLKVSWQSKEAGNPRVGCDSSAVSANLPRHDQWNCGYGLIRLDLVPMTDLNREAFMRNMFTAFLSPVQGGVGQEGSVSYTAGTNIHGGSASQGLRPAARCDQTRCAINITGLSAGKYYARVSTLYRDAKLQIAARTDGNSQDLPLYGTQVVVDVTGKAVDVLRRIQVRVPLVGDGLHADYGVQTNDTMCKQFTSFSPENPTSDPKHQAYAYKLDC